MFRKKSKEIDSFNVKTTEIRSQKSFSQQLKTVFVKAKEGVKLLRFWLSC